MKRLFFITLLISSLFISCNEMGTSVFSVNQEEVTKSAEGSMVIYIDKDGEPFQFTGNLNLVDGQGHLLLQTPVLDTTFVNDTVFKLDSVQLPDSVYVVDSINKTISHFLRDTVYNETFTPPTDIKFNEEFNRIIGEWLFTYEILPYNDTDPYGNFDFTFSYSD